MKITIRIIIIFFVCASSCLAQKSILINGIKYKITKNKIFLKDEELMVYSNYFYNNKNKFQFGYTLESKRNDSVFIRGKIKIKDKKITCIERYYFNYFRWDSIVRNHVQLKNGRVIMKEYIEYKNGLKTRQEKY